MPHFSRCNMMPRFRLGQHVCWQCGEYGGDGFITQIAVEKHGGGRVYYLIGNGWIQEEFVRCYFE
jgi:hypothetical protein